MSPIRTEISSNNGLKVKVALGRYPSWKLRNQPEIIPSRVRNPGGPWHHLLQWIGARKLSEETMVLTPSWWKAVIPLALASSHSKKKHRSRLDQPCLLFKWS
jgi:hypothetical protein